MVMRSQKEITLREDLDVRDRLDIYRNFLLYCMSGDVVALPMGSTGAAPGWVTQSPLCTGLLVALAPALVRHHRAISVCQSTQGGSRFRWSPCFFGACLHEAARGHNRSICGPRFMVRSAV